MSPPEFPHLHRYVADGDRLVHRSPSLLGELLDVGDALAIRRTDGHFDQTILHLDDSDEDLHALALALSAGRALSLLN
jgi:hypothetical protein